MITQTVTTTWPSRPNLPPESTTSLLVLWEARDFLNDRKWRRSFRLSRMEMKRAIRIARHVVVNYESCVYCGQHRYQHSAGKCLFDVTYFLGIGRIPVGRSRTRRRGYLPLFLLESKNRQP